MRHARRGPRNRCDGSRLKSLTTVPLLALLAASCGAEEEKKLDYHLLATDVHAFIAGQPIGLPLIAVSGYTREGRRSRIDWQTSDQAEIAERSTFSQKSANQGTALHLDQITVGIGTYGWNDSDRRSHDICPRLTQRWAKSVCENPWAALQQSLPDERFHLADLRRLDRLSNNDGLNCINDSDRKVTAKMQPGEAALLCEAEVWGASSTTYHTAVIKIAGNLGAYWLVWGGPKDEETPIEMANREGAAIRAFALHGVGATEDFYRLHDTACSLRRPKSADGPGGSDCRSASPK